MLAIVVAAILLGQDNLGLEQALQQTMPFEITELNHVQLTVPSAAEQAAKYFYRTVLGLQEIPKPAGPRSPRSKSGAWYRCGNVELHLSVEDLPANNRASRRHVCFMVTNMAAAEATMREAAIEIIPDNQPIEGWRRFYVRDPGGNRIEIAERSEPPPSGARSKR
jgi:catechol 2,3-dioxygenase-like lactoylglutathione lyase family enzyme